MFFPSRTRVSWRLSCGVFGFCSSQIAFFSLFVVLFELEYVRTPTRFFVVIFLYTPYRTGYRFIIVQPGLVPIHTADHVAYERHQQLQQAQPDALEPVCEMSFPHAFLQSLALVSADVFGNTLAQYRVRTRN